MSIRKADEWQTPPEWIERFSRVLGDIGLDPCWSNVEGQRYDPFADLTWGIEDDALSINSYYWEENGPIFMNPPYSDPAPWVDKLSDCELTFYIALLNSSTSARWWHKMYNASDYIAFPRKRIGYIDPVSGVASRQNRYDQTIFIYGPSLRTVICELEEFCTIAKVI